MAEESVTTETESSDDEICLSCESSSFDEEFDSSSVAPFRFEPYESGSCDHESSEQDEVEQTANRRLNNNNCLCLGDNKLVSSNHCFLQKDENGDVWLNDTSTNGTLLNKSTKITKGSKKLLQHGDEFYIVFKKDDTSANIGFVYQDNEELEKEMNETQEYSPNLDATLIDEDINVADEIEEQQLHIIKPEKRKLSACKEDDETKNKRNKTENTNDHSVKAEEKKPTIEQSATDSEKSGSKAPEFEGQGVSGSAVKESNKNDIEKQDDIEEALLCSICQELLHDCISLQPCMHSFCAGCYSEWMDQSNECPTCRIKVDRINKNHIVNNLIDAYLKEHPEKKRPEEDIKELNSKNKISRDMLYPKQNKGYADSDEYNSDSDEDNIRIQPPMFNLPPPVIPMLAGFGTPFFGNIPGRTICRQCPDYQEPANNDDTNNNNADDPAAENNNINTAINTETNSSSASANVSDESSQATQLSSASDDPTPGPSARPVFAEDAKVMPEPPNYRCTNTQNHVLCQCCLQPMPDRRGIAFLAPRNPTTDPPQQCFICYRTFCHAYWGCRKADCAGCLSKFKDFRFGNKCWGGIILNNQYESDIFRGYLQKKNLSLKAVLDDCIPKLERGEYTCSDKYRPGFDGNVALCFPCALRNFKDLTYQYRENIPNVELPVEVTSRPNCYWGKNCRTQKNKPEHAKKFNHICNQTRY